MRVPKATAPFFGRPIITEPRLGPYVGRTCVPPEDLEVLRLVIADKITHLEEDPKWTSVDERDVIIQALDELVVQAAVADADRQPRGARQLRPARLAK